MKNRFCALLALAAVLSIGQAARADQISFSFSDGSISTWGTSTVSNTPTVIDGVTGLEVTGVSGFFNDAALGITSHHHRDLHPRLVQHYPRASIAFSTAGNSYDDLYFPGGNSPATARHRIPIRFPEAFSTCSAGSLTSTTGTPPSCGATASFPLTPVRSTERQSPTPLRIWTTRGIWSRPRSRIHFPFSPPACSESQA